MKQIRWKPYLLFLLLTEAVGALAGFLTRRGVQNYHSVPKSALTPPDWVFPVVWAILFLLMAIGAARVSRSDSPKRTAALTLFGVQLAANFLWSLVFFNLQAFGFAFFWLIVLWVLILIMTLLFARVDRIAAWLQLPYLLWVIFAGYLNCLTWLLNR